MRRTRIGFPRAALLCAGFVAAILAAPPALAGAAGATYFAAPFGSGETCSEDSPCTIYRAVAEAGDGDSVHLDGGTYTLGISGLTITHAIDIGGEPGLPAHLDAVYPFASLHVSEGDPATVHDVRLEGSNLQLGSGSADRVYVSYPGEHEPLAPTAACELGDGAILRDSVCWAAEFGEVSEANGVEMLTSDEGTHRTAVLRNVTAIAADAGGHGLLGIGGASQTTIEGSNVIARAANASDVFAGRTSSAFPELDIELDHSNYATVEEEAPRAVASPAGAGTNQSAAPLFADPVAGDFHELAGSPTIDAGASQPENGLLDLDSASRSLPGCLGAAAVPDIGAYELEATAPCPVPPTPVEERLPEPPKPLFRILKVAVHGAKGSVQIETPGAGMLTLTGSGVKLVTRSAAAPQVFTLPLKPWAITLVRLRQAGQTKVRLKVRFAAEGAPPKEIRRGVVFRAGR
jgi:hypothetical protein